MKSVRTWDIGALRCVVTLEVEKVRAWDKVEYSAHITDASVESSDSGTILKGVPSFPRHGGTPYEAINAVMAHFENWLREQKIIERT